MFSDFIQNSPIFNSAAMSKQCRESMIRTLQGLGLPTPQYCNKPPFGYQKIDGVYMPIEHDLLILLKACEMAASRQYLQDDILIWIEAAKPSRKFEKRQFSNIKSDRPPFPELRLPVEERINLVYRTTARPTKEAPKREEISREASTATSG